MELDSFIYTDQGGRANNEDAAGERRFAEGGVFVVADGLGGHAEGEVASETVRRTLLEELPPVDGGADWLSARIEKANRNIVELQKVRQNNMKSTVVALVIQGEKAHWGNVGDSRLYYIHAGKLAACTEDHSVAYRKYKAGEITRAQIPQDPDQNHLTRAVGNEDRSRVMVDMYTCHEPLMPGDGFLLCSDGVWEYLHDEEITADLIGSATAKDWGERLLCRIMARIAPGNDNMTLITVRVL